MKINKLIDGSLCTIGLEGRLDTTTAPELEKELDGTLDTIKELVFDFAQLDYISSAGLRVILAAQKKMNNLGTMKIINVKPEVLEVFEITGFTSILTIE